MSVALTYKRREPFSFRGFCVDVNHYVDDTVVYRGRLYSSTEPVPLGGALVHPENLELANYLLTKRFAGSTFEPPGTPAFEISADNLQGALWDLVSSGAPESTRDYYGGSKIDALVNDALEHGRGFVPKPGQHATMVVVADANLDRSDENDVQTLVIDVTVPGDVTCGVDFVEPCEPRDVPDPPAPPAH
jgi:hypothetical protein